ncbi:uncharacterized protein LOC131240027 [Magnolia sinica]|uniref:uncharacterized protein LOC131240027 n=1 Tax=Magnolia sinica TaxID=86752 RepID=UPI002657DFD8|nr:uncharacterized protein LOC131240027 [Magnolia sinica]
MDWTNTFLWPSDMRATICTAQMFHILIRLAGVLLVKACVCVLHITFLLFLAQIYYCGPLSHLMIAIYTMCNSNGSALLQNVLHEVPRTTVTFCPRQVQASLSALEDAMEAGYEDFKFLEVVRLEGHAITQKEVVLSRDIHLL